MFPSNKSLLVQLKVMKGTGSIKDYKQLYDNSSYNLKLNTIFLWSVTNGEINATEMCLNVDETVAHRVYIKKYESVLHLAIHKNHIPHIKLYYRKKICIHKRDRFDRTPILYAARHGKTQIVKLLLSLGANPHDETSKKEQILHMACKKGNLELVKMILDLGHNVNEITECGKTPLFYAIAYVAAQNSFKIIQELLTRGADITHKTETGQTPLKTAVKTGKLDLIHFIIANLPGSVTQSIYNDCIYFGLLYGHLHIAKFALGLGATLNHKDRMVDINLLQCAIRSGNINCVQWLLENALKVNNEFRLESGLKINNEFRLESDVILSRYTFDAILSNNIGIIELLVKRGCDFNAVAVKINNNDGTFDGRNCLEVAVSNHCSESLLWLLMNTRLLYTCDNIVDLRYIEYCCYFARVTCLMLILRALQIEKRLTHDILRIAFNATLSGENYNHLRILHLLQCFGYISMDEEKVNEIIANPTDKPSFIVDFVEKIKKLDWQERVVYVCTHGNFPDVLKSMLQNGFDLHQSTRSTNILSLCDLFATHQFEKPSYKGYKNMKSLITRALLPWSPKRHFLHGLQFRHTIFKIFLFKYCCESYFCEMNGAVLPILPKEIWILVSQFIQRCWFIESTSYNINNTFKIEYYTQNKL